MDTVDLSRFAGLSHVDCIGGGAGRPQPLEARIDPLHHVGHELASLPHYPGYEVTASSLNRWVILAYHAAVIRGKDVAKPRNLAKSVTVE